MALQTFEVTYQATAATPDLGPTDLDLEPERIPVAGYVTFTPSVSVLVEDDASPEDVFVEPQTYALLNGVLVDGGGNPAVTLISPWSTDLGLQGWQWTATFDLRGGLRHDPVHLPVGDCTPGATVNLTRSAPIALLNAVPVLRGPKGEPGATGATGATGPAGSSGVNDSGLAALINNESSFLRAALDAMFVRKDEITATPLPPSSPTVGQVWIKNG